MGVEGVPPRKKYAQLHLRWFQASVLCLTKHKGKKCQFAKIVPKRQQPQAKEPCYTACPIGVRRLVRRCLSEWDIFLLRILQEK